VLTTAFAKVAFAGDVAAEITRLKQQDGGDIEVYGSTTLVQTLMRHNLVDEYRVAVHPIVLGGGTHLFPEGGGVSATLRLTATGTLDSGVVSLTYVPETR
jgi:dihydrofolate reductase